MTSQDVIHSFFVPAFRIKQDVLPGRYTSLWFQPTKVGRYHLFCAEYCGTNHSGMGGWVEVMEPADYERWLVEGGAGPSMAEEGERLFVQHHCAGCHRGSQTVRAPRLEGVYGRPVPIQEGKRRPLRHGRRALHPRLDPAAQVAGRGRVRAGDAVVPGPDQRGRSAQDHRLHQVDRARRRRADECCRRSRSRKTTSRHYTLEVVAADDRPQADRPAVHGLDHVLLLRRRRRGDAHAAGADDAAGATSCHSPDTYNKLFTMHGVVMVFFFLIPSIPAVLGNFLVPLMIGARDLAFPELNLLSWYIYMIGGLDRRSGS